MQYPSIYLHPSRWAIIDDEERFLRDLESRIPNGQGYETFIDPSTAVNAINSINSLYRARFDSFLEVYTDPSDSNLYDLDVDKFQALLNDNVRRSVFSVAICDFLMPSMTGLEFFSEVDDPNIVRILLTGAADEKLAVSAFNNGQIDRFVMKSDPDVVSKLWMFSKELNLRYFRDIEKTFLSMLMLSRRFLGKLSVKHLLSEVFGETSISEYYFVEKPAGYIAFSAAGTLHRLIIMEESDFEDAVRYAVSNGAPRSVIDMLLLRTHVAYFYDKVENCYGENYDWESYMVPSEKLEMGVELWIGCLDSPPIDIDFRGGI